MYFIWKKAKKKCYQNMTSILTVSSNNCILYWMIDDYHSMMYLIKNLNCQTYFNEKLNDTISKFTYQN